MATHGSDRHGRPPQSPGKADGNPSPPPPLASSSIKSIPTLPGLHATRSSGGGARKATETPRAPARAEHEPELLKEAETAGRGKMPRRARPDRAGRPPPRRLTDTGAGEGSSVAADPTKPETNPE